MNKLVQACLYLVLRPLTAVLSLSWHESSPFVGKGEKERKLKLIRLSGSDKQLAE